MNITGDSTFIKKTSDLILRYEFVVVDNNNNNKNNMKPEWNYLNAVFYCGTVFTTIGKLKYSDECVCFGSRVLFQLNF